MLVSHAVEMFLDYHRANSSASTVRNPRSAIELAWTAGSGRFRRKRGVVDSSDLFGRCLFYCQRVSAPR